jgi:hypothetical protein
MKVLSTKEIVNKLIGPVMPVGESHTDGDRFDNLLQLVELTEALINDLVQVASDKDSHMHSVKKAGEYADRALKEFHDELSERMERP